MIEISLPKTAQKLELTYVIDWVFGSLFGLTYNISIGQDQEFLEIRNLDSSLRISSRFFCYSDEAWQLKKFPTPSSSQSLQFSHEYLKSNISNANIPILFGGPNVTYSEQRITSEADLFGSIFFLITRLEETEKSCLDEHQRFPCDGSILSKLNLLQRPIVDEYVELLRHWLLTLWPQLKLNTPSYHVQVSCDVDRPLNYWARNIRSAWRKPIGELIHQRNPSLALRSLKDIYAHCFNTLKLDTNNTFDWIMDVNEAAGNEVVFYFLAGVTNPHFDASYLITDPFIQTLLRNIDSRGHRIGLHPSYDCYLSGHVLQKELESLNDVLSSLGIDKPVISSRQHYLRWDSAVTPQLLERAGIKNDSTLGYSNEMGFRCGTSYNYPLYDLQERKQLNLIEHPLIVMDQALISAQHNSRELESRISEALKIRDECKKYGGNFNILWHNSELTAKTKPIYRSLIAS